MPRKDVQLLKRMNTKAQDLLVDDGDLRLIINANYEQSGSLRKVKGYTQLGDNLSSIVSTNYKKTADFNTGTFSNTEAINDSVILSGGSIAQSQYNSNYKVYGNNWIAQSFMPTGNTILKISLYLDKVLGAALQLYDDFEIAGTPDASKWFVTGTVTNVSGRLKIVGRVGGTGITSSVSTGGKTGSTPPGQPILGLKTTNIDFTEMGPEISGDVDYIELTDGTDYIRLVGGGGVNQVSLYTTSYYGGAAGVEQARWDGRSGSYEIVQSGVDILIYWNGVPKITIYNTTIKANSYFHAIISLSNSGSLNTSFYLDDLYFYENVTQLSDGNISIQTDLAGAPSGVPISNGSATVSSVNVGTSVSAVETSFSSPAVVAGNTYWIVFNQTGGDSSNYYRVYKQNSTVYDFGSASVSSNAGSTWAADPDGNTDIAFIIFGNYYPTGYWITANIILASTQTLSQITLKTKDLSPTNYISRVDIVNTSNVSQSNYSTIIQSGSSLTLRSSDFNNGFTFTNGNTFKIQISFVSAGSISPVLTELDVDNNETNILELSPLYQGKAGTKILLAVIAGTLKRFVSNQWVTVVNYLTSGLLTKSVIARASKGPKVIGSTVTSASSTTFVDTAIFPAPNAYQGYLVKIVSGPGVGQVRLIDSNTGTSTSTTTTTSSTTSTTTSTTTTRSTSTTKSTSTTHT